VRLLRLVLNITPACLRWHPENILGGILVAVLDQGLGFLARDALRLQFVGDFLAASFERVGNVLQKNQTENDMLVLCGVDGAAEFIGRLP
jgi:hypothetical protein